LRAHNITILTAVGILSLVATLAQAQRPDVVGAPPRPAGRGIFNEDKKPLAGKAPEQVGQWMSVADVAGRATGINIGGQSVQTAVLPNGVILVVNGSSNREGVDPLKITDVQNSFLFNPKTLRSLKIPATPEPQLDAAALGGGFMIDPFCGGHNHLPDGRVLFVGGTKRYDSQFGKTLGQGFLGTREAWIFDWTQIQLDARGMMSLRANPWNRLRNPTGGPPLVEGRWYPAVVTLGDGKLAVWGGFKHEGDGMISEKVEIFDPAVADTRFAWTAIDWEDQGVRLDAQNHPPKSIPTDANNGWSAELDLYPRIFQMPDGRFYFPGDGVGVGNRFGHATFYAQLDLAGKRVLWDFGDTRKPVDRPANKFYGTALIDPRPSLRNPGTATGDLVVIGGGVGNIDLADGKANTPLNPGGGNDRTLDNTRPDLRVTADLETYTAPLLQRVPGRPAADAEEFGLWKVFENALQGPRAERIGKGRDGRINHQSVLLPTGEILVVGGGSYGYGNPHFFPVLFTPHEILDGKPVIEDPLLDTNVAGFRRRTLSPHQFPRLYHTTAVLIPDGRVVLLGGNPFRATVRQRGPRGEVVTGGLSFENDFNKGFAFDQPAEEHTVEIFKPPYLFNGTRPVIRAMSAFDPVVAARAAFFTAERERLTGSRAAPLAAAVSPPGLPLGPTRLPLVSRRQQLRIEIAPEGMGDLAKAKVTLVKLAAATHSSDVGQKFVRLQAQFTREGNTVVATASFPNQVLNGVPAGKRTLNAVPVGMNMAPVGTYMLFVVSDQGVPSEAEVIELVN
jgi:hypothetical protein